MNDIPLQIGSIGIRETSGDTVGTSEAEQFEARMQQVQIATAMKLARLVDLLPDPTDNEQWMKIRELLNGSR
jgi:hypothetical protein